MVRQETDRENPPKVTIGRTTIVGAGFFRASNPGAPGSQLGGAVEDGLARDHRKLEPVGDADLVEHAGEMMFDGLLADRTLPGDFLVRAAVRDHPQHLALAG